MAGHSKWATTKRHKATIDAKRGKLFSIIGKEITIAARSGGGDCEFNSRLRMLIMKARSVNMPTENIDRAIKKGTGELPGQMIEELMYEGYAPGGVGVLIEVTTDSKNRTASDVRSAFTKLGGNLAGSGALAFNFQRVGQFFVDQDAISEESLLEIVLDAGADDVKKEDKYFEILCSVRDFDRVSTALEDRKVQVESSELVYLPNSTVKVEDIEVAKKVIKLMDILEDLEDVKAVYSNFDIDEALIQGLKP